MVDRSTLVFSLIGETRCGVLSGWSVKFSHSASSGRSVHHSYRHLILARSVPTTTAPHCATSPRFRRCRNRDEAVSDAVTTNEGCSHKKDAAAVRRVAVWTGSTTEQQVKRCALSLGNHSEKFWKLYPLKWSPQHRVESSVNQAKTRLRPGRSVGQCLSRSRATLLPLTSHLCLFTSHVSG